MMSLILEALNFMLLLFICNRPLKDVSELKDYLEFMYTGAAQYDDPQEYPVNKACEGIDGDSEGTYTLGRIFSGIVALRGENSCHDVDEFFSDETLDSSWGWQVCDYR